jgi:hypothetical protein
MMEQATFLSILVNEMLRGTIFPILREEEMVMNLHFRSNLMNHFKVEVPHGEGIVDISVKTPYVILGLIIACNMIGHVWTVDQDTHNTVTCEFYDREAHHQYFFTDPYLYDKACLSIIPLKFVINSR